MLLFALEGQYTEAEKEEVKITMCCESYSELALDIYILLEG